MALVAKSVFEHLNSLELALLILAAYFHDQGMIFDDAELGKLRSSDSWRVYEDNWRADHPNYAAARARLSDPHLTDRARQPALTTIGELEAAMLTDFIRHSHGAQSAAFVTTRYATDPRLMIYGTSLATSLARLVASHVYAADWITAANGLAFDEYIGPVAVNLALLAHILRLADILDFDNERTPDVLYRAIHFSSGVSLLEWQKHRSIKGWEIGPRRIAFRAECAHPAYERAVRAFLSLIDAELLATATWSRSLPAEYSRHFLELPQIVDRSKVGPATDPVTGLPTYKYFDLEFGLSRDEIVRLLMTDKLYNSRHLFVRELLQNGLDALRHRRALYRSAGVAEPELLIKFEHRQDEGVDVVSCVDNGVGMDTDVITRFLTRAGRSYYRSPEFELERRRFAEKGCDFDPCARFGIGFMSCFMLGDDITIRTRRDYGIGQDHGPPLEVEIAGVSGIIAVRPGPPTQPVGTTVEVRGRRVSFTVDEWSDPVELIEVLEGYAIALEFPVRARCTVAGIEQSLELEPAATARAHPVEGAGGPFVRVYSQRFAAFDKHLEGEVRVALLAGDGGMPVLENAAARVVVREKANEMVERVMVLRSGRTIQIDRARWGGQVCCDGILVAGQPGRRGSHMRLGHYPANHGFGLASFLIDARGPTKPVLTPARRPPEDHFRAEPSWKRLFSIAGRAYAALLDDVAASCSLTGDPELFWAVAEVYGLDLYYLRAESIWRYLAMPVYGRTGGVDWRSLQALRSETLSLRLTKPELDCVTVGADRSIALPVDARGWNRPRRSYVNDRVLRDLLVSVARLEAVSADECVLWLEAPSAGCGQVADSVVRDWDGWQYFVDFRGELESVVCVAAPSVFANRSHPAVARLRTSATTPWDERSPLERLLGFVTWNRLRTVFDADVPLDSWEARNRALVARLYGAVDWRDVADSVSPPYRVFRPGAGIDELRVEHFERWARAGYLNTAKPPDDEEDSEFETLE